MPFVPDAEEMQRLVRDDAGETLAVLQGGQAAGGDVVAEDKRAIGVVLVADVGLARPKKCPQRENAASSPPIWIVEYSPSCGGCVTKRTSLPADSRSSATSSASMITRPSHERRRRAERRDLEIGEANRSLVINRAAIEVQQENLPLAGVREWIERQNVARGLRSVVEQRCSIGCDPAHE